MSKGELTPSERAAQRLGWWKPGAWQCMYHDECPLDDAECSSHRYPRPAPDLEHDPALVGAMLVRLAEMGQIVDVHYFWPRHEWQACVDQPGPVESGASPSQALVAAINALPDAEGIQAMTPEQA